MTSNSYFVADIHLTEEDPRMAECFIKFCKIMAANKASLYIQGDLFDAWLGDDMMTPAEKRILLAIGDIAKNGGRTFFQRGNRDFLVGNEFLTLSHCEVLTEQSFIELDGKRIILDHGDSLCVADEEFMRVREFSRTKETINMLLSKSPEERQRLKQEFMKMSDGHKSRVEQDALSADEDYIHKILVDKDADAIIYGHFHSPLVKDTEVENKKRRLVCLSNWGDQDAAWFARLDAGVLNLYKLPLNNIDIAVAKAFED